MSWLRDISVGLEELTDVYRLSAPEVTVDTPVQGELEGLPVETSVWQLVSVYSEERSQRCAHTERECGSSWR